MKFFERPVYKHSVRNDWTFEMDSEIPVTMELLKQIQFEGDIPDSASVHIRRRLGEPTYTIIFTTVKER